MVSIINSFSNTPAPTITPSDFYNNHNFIRSQEDNKFFTLSIDIKNLTFTDNEDKNNNHIIRLLKLDPSRFDFIKTNLNNIINKEINRLYEDEDNENFINTITYNLNDDLILNIEILFNDYIKPLISFECFVCYKTLNNYIDFFYCDNLHEGARLCLDCVKECQECPLCRGGFRDLTETTEENKYIRQYKFIMKDLNKYFKNKFLMYGFENENRNILHFINSSYIKFNKKYYLMLNLKLGDMVNNLPFLNNWIYHNDFINILNNIEYNEPEDKANLFFNLMKEIFKFYFDYNNNDNTLFINLVSSYMKIYDNIDETKFNDIILLINSHYKFKKNYAVNLYYIYYYFNVLFNDEDDREKKLKDIANKIIRDEKFNNISNSNRNIYNYKNNKLYEVKYLQTYIDDLTLLYIERKQTDLNHYTYNLDNLKKFHFTIIKDIDLYNDIKNDFEGGVWINYYSALYECATDENYISNFSVETYENIIYRFVNEEVSGYSSREFYNKTFRYDVDYDRLYDFINNEDGHYIKKEIVITYRKEEGAGGNNEIRYFLYSDEWEELNEIINIEDDDTSQEI
jgi:hypothetical protein